MERQQNMGKVLVFGILSLPLIYLSWRTLFSFKSHGFYRFFSWECIVWLFVNNYPFWFNHPLSIKQILSWSFLFFSIYLVVAGTTRLKKAGKPNQSRNEKALYAFEKTSELIDTGIYKYIRHPLYSSLLFLTWGIFLKNTTDSLFVVAIFSTAFLYVTARLDEKECIQYFGDPYCEYMRRSKRFIPFLI